jgi:hypothetical protein
MGFQLGTHRTSIDSKADAIAKLKAAAGTKPEDGALIKYISPSECPDRSRLVFDDSGSMGGQIENAKKGVVEYFRNCIPNQTAAAIHFMNTKSKLDQLSSNLLQLSQDITAQELNMGGTPFFNTLKKALQAEPKLTRVVAFTDGSPTDELQAEENEEAGMQAFFARHDSWLKSADIIITIAKAVGGTKCIPIDTVFFGSAGMEREISLLRYLSEKTGGFFLHFDPSKPNIWKQLKYLTPGKRMMLTDGNFRAKVERGE